jgi:hypothetical protein
MIFCLPMLEVFGDETGLEVVFLIDQSGSMYGLDSKTHALANDPKGVRISMVQNVIRRMAEKVQGTAMIHHVSVIEFGGDAKRNQQDISVVVSNCELQYDPHHPGQTIPRVDSCREIERLKPKHLNDTHTHLAMKTALAEFQKFAATNTTGTPAQAKLLLITDGRPDKKGMNLAELRNEIKKYANDMKQLGIGIDVWVIGLNDATNYWDTGDREFWEHLTEDASGRDSKGLSKASLAEQASKMEKRVEYIVDQWLNANTNTVVGKEHHIRPYLKRITFNVKFNTTGSSVDITYPDGQVKSVMPGTSLGEPVPLIVPNPLPGTYRIKSPPSSAMTVEEELPTAQLLAPLGRVNQNVASRIVLQVIQEGQPLVVSSNWPITANITTTPPSGKPEKLLATVERDGQFAVAWTPAEAGDYQIDFQGQFEVLVDDKGTKQPYELVDKNQVRGKITVLPYTPGPGPTPVVPPNSLWVHLENPNPQKGLSISQWGGETAAIQLSLYEGEKPVTDLKTLVSDPEKWLTLQVMDKSGVPFSPDTIAMKPTDNGKLVAEVPLTLAGIDNEKDGRKNLDTLHFKIVADPKQLPAGRTLEGIFLPPEAEVHRIAGNPMTVADIEIWRVWGGLFSVLRVLLLLLLIGIVLLGVSYLVFPWVSIHSEDKGRPVYLLIYDGVNDPNMMTPDVRESITGQLAISLDRQVSLSVGGTQVTAEYFHIQRRPNAGTPFVKVRYRWPGEKKENTHEIYLTGNSPKPLEGLAEGNYMVVLGY